MKKFPAYLLLLSTSILFKCADAQSQTKIPLRPDMVINLTGFGDATKLVDEQEMAGDPAAKVMAHPKSGWHPGWKDWQYPAAAVIDLGATYAITDIYLYDGKSTGANSVYGGTPDKWELLLTDKLPNYRSWNRHRVTYTGRYLKYTLDRNGAVAQEIVLYGEKVAPEKGTAKPVVAAKQVAHPKALMKNLIGLNGFIDDDLEVLATGGFLREYHEWQWSEAQKDELKFAPSYPGWDFDQYYKSLKEAGVTVAPSLKSSVSWLSGNREHKPIQPGADATDPLAYKEKASFMFQYAARYGATKVNKNLLKLAPGQEPKTGLGYLQYYEDWNEQNADWMGREAYFTPLEYAAMASASYDGHLGQLGPGHGTKTADPKAIAVMGGLAGLDLDYVRAIKLWSDYNRKGSFPADVLNFHHYSRKLSADGKNMIGSSPEEDSLKQKLQALVAYRDAHLPGKPIWLTEFGYDVHPQSVQRAPAIGSFTAEEMQALWLIRSYLAVAAAGVDRAAMYMSRDVDVAAAMKYSTSGLTDGKNGRKKHSWYHLKTFYNLLGNMQFDQEVPSGHPEVLCYKFKEPGSANAVYVLWSPTSRQHTVPDYSFQIHGNTRVRATVQQQGAESVTAAVETKPKQGRLQLQISENPLYVLVTEK